METYNAIAPAPADDDRRKPALRREPALPLEPALLVILREIYLEVGLPYRAAAKAALADYTCSFEETFGFAQ